MTSRHLVLPYTTRVVRLQTGRPCGVDGTARGVREDLSFERTLSTRFTIIRMRCSLSSTYPSNAGGGTEGWTGGGSARVHGVHEWRSCCPCRPLGSRPPQGVVLRTVVLSIPHLYIEHTVALLPEFC